MNRILAVARLQATGRRDGLLWPLAVLAASFAVNFAIFASMGEDPSEQPVTGGLASIYIAVFAFGAVAVSQQFPFTLGMSVTRREFTAALGLFVLGQSLLYATVLVVLQAVEEATGGWGIHLRFFGLHVFDRHHPAAQFAAYAVPLLLASLLGAAIGAVYVRWKTNGVFAATVLTLAALGGAAALVTKFRGWSAVGGWLARQDLLALFAGWPLLLVALLALTSWATLRRATA